MIRFLDLVFSLAGIILLSPVLLITALIIRIDSPGPVFFVQPRVGRNGREFRLIKFRSMRVNAEKAGGLTVGARDSRITRSGYLLRKYKIDELPQLINVLRGEMSLVGPRPEIRKYTALYTPEQAQVLSVRPGITDYASIEYIQENELLGKAAEPEKVYIETIIPAKIELNMRYIRHQTTGEYLKILLLTFAKIFRQDQ